MMVLYTDIKINYTHVTMNSKLSRLMKGKRCMDNQKTWIIQNILFGVFTAPHKLLYISLHNQDILGEMLCNGHLDL
jgi:hypothetical protein